MSPENIQWVGEDPRVNHRRGFGGSGNGMSRFVGCGSVPGVGRGRGTTLWLEQPFALIKCHSYS